jgi:hypothetical protein
MFKGRVARLVLAGALLSSPIMVPTIAGILHFEPTSAAAPVPGKNQAVQGPALGNDPQKAVNLSASSISPEEARARATHAVEAMSLLLWGVSLVGLSMLLKWTVKNRQKQQVSASE